MKIYLCGPINGCTDDQAKWLTGHGGAKKEHMISAVQKRFGIVTNDDNIADAIAVMERARAEVG